MVVFWIVALTGLRAAVMDYILVPVAELVKIERKDRIRFTEQAWVVIYGSVFFSLGMVRARLTTLGPDKQLTQKTVSDVYVQLLARPSTIVGRMARQRADWTF